MDCETGSCLTDGWMDMAEVEAVMDRVAYVRMSTDSGVALFQNRSGPDAVVTLDIHLGKIHSDDLVKGLSDYGISSDLVASAFVDCGFA